MSVTVYIPSSQQQSSKKKITSRKRRQNQNEEIHELASLVPLSSNQAGSLVASNGGKPHTISVLRLTTTFLKLQSFMKDASPSNDSSGEHVSLGRMEEAIDGFLIVLDKEANILYVSETIAGHVGLIQQDVIGQNLADITNPEFSADSLKPSLILPTSVEDEFVVSQYRQFFVRLKPSVSYSTLPSHSIVQVCGNLKVQLSPSKTVSSGKMEFVEPSVIGFIGECRVVESVASILEISIPHSTYTATRTLDMKKIISIEATVKDIIGYDPRDLMADGVAMTDFIHPADQILIKERPEVEFFVRKGRFVSPLFRFLTSSGEWVWQQVEAKLRYKSGTSIPHFWEGKIKVLGQWGGNLKYIKQREFYQSVSDQGSWGDIGTVPDPKLTSTLSKYRTEDGAKPIIDSLKSTRMPDSVLEPVLHGRSIAVDKISELVKLTVENVMQCDRVKACRMQRKEDGCFLSDSVSTNNSELSPSSVARCSPTTLNCSQISSGLPITPSDSAMQLHTPAIANELSHSIPHLHIHEALSNVPNSKDQNGVQSRLMSDSSIDSSPASSTMMVTPHPQEVLPSTEQCFNSTNPVSDSGYLHVLETHSPCSFATSAVASPANAYPTEVDTMLHTASSTDSIPSATSIPFHNPNFISQAPLSDFDPHILASFDFSNNFASPSQSPNTCYSSPFHSTSAALTSVSLPTVQAFDSSSDPLMSSCSDPLMHQLVGGGEMMDESNVDIMASLSGAAVSVDSMASHFCPQNNNTSAPLQDTTLSNPAHLNTNFAPCISIHSQSSNFYACQCSSDSEVQDILQQFM